MRNYQLRKANTELTLKKKFFLANNKWEQAGNVYMYIRLCSLGFGVTVLIFQNSKKKKKTLPKQKSVKTIKIKNKK